MIKSSKSEFHFNWEGIDALGIKIKGRNSAATKQQLQQNLQAKGIYLLSIKKESWALYLKSKPINHKHIVNFTHQFTLLLEAGIEIVPALTMIAAQIKSINFQELLFNIKQKIENGNMLSQTLQAYPQYFDPIYINLISAGEASGQLVSLLIQLTAYQQRSLVFKQKIMRALYYPLIVGITALLITIALLIFVVPQFKTIFSSMNAPLPMATQVVIALSEFLEKNSLMLCSLIFGGVVLNYYAIKKFSFCQTIWQSILMRLPIISYFIQQCNLTRVLSVINTLLKSGLPLINALQLSEPLLSLNHYKKGMLEMINALANGKTLQESIQYHPLFNSKTRNLLAVAEQTGDLTKTLQILTEQNERELNNALDQISKLIEPVMMLILAMIVGGIIIAMYLPIFKLGSIM